jgi:alkanesulfonate monooxygenase SsuD/methylene tetrahydromethanopterin reductase-like flavin-dependent oxidoreductase (luciferase family)
MYTADRCRDSFFKVKGFAEEAGRVLPKDYIFACFIYVAMYDDVKDARKRGLEELTYRYDQDFSERDLVDKYCAYGPPDRIIEYLAKYIEAGANYLILAPIMPPQQRLDHLERLAREVVPALDKIEPGKIL